MTASLEKELEAARDKDTRAEVLKRLGQVHRERHDLAQRAPAVERRAGAEAAGRLDLSLAGRAVGARGQPGRGGRDAAQAAARGQGEGREAQPPAAAGAAVRRAAARSRRRRVGLPGDPGAAAGRPRCVAPARGGVRAQAGEEAEARAHRDARDSTRRRRRRRRRSCRCCIGWRRCTRSAATPARRPIGSSAWSSSTRTTSRR